ncbi:MAG: hypothetical protein COT81_04790 [Candidatus Buchananbacteria bacterium CG10_big_fil_rev_8_21_14_0_10_42_9]|uniref:Bacterial type II secretion system protein E domain-containing protein n=1 Tax=Candidatus Buchananbacteria bacterium CG10_big_fil_rev_8_21_14_0_10_42_9 TaxID=1974526 RepID=A0A2H0W0B7_9BACT|nr:MAG: hypothetical protein COT81_04790 [Candidatus Buchananbacteria bacterium CG10_big_fil_rev_8_21_14_0_10_42_9]
MHISNEKLKSMLLDSGFVDETSINSAIDQAQRSNEPVTEVLTERGDVPEQYMVELLTPYFGVNTVDLNNVSISQEVLHLIPESYAHAKNVILFEIDTTQKIAKVAMLDPIDFDTIEYLRQLLDAWVEPYLTTPSGLRRAMILYKRKISEDFKQSIQENIKKSITTSAEGNLSKLADQVSIVSIIDNIIGQAAAMGASDIHFEPLANEILIRYRVDGILQEVISLPKQIAPILVARVKILGSLQIDEHSKPQDGRFRQELLDQPVDIRVSIIPVYYGEKVEMRILRGSTQRFSLEDLGLSGAAMTIIQEEIKKPHGMILVTGPTGHGKTTTLYAFIHILNTPKVNIVTIEDPIEYEVSRINQTQVNPKAGLTFANGLRSLLRQNPDIILVGEIRDEETVDIATHSALTGHLVLSSLHTNDAASTVPRLIDMKAAPFLLSSTLNLIVAQRLVRRICRACVASYKITSEEERLVTAQLSINESSERRIQIPQTLYKGQGCDKCNKEGFQGQIGIFELLKVSEEIRRLIAKKAPAAEIKKTAISQGMITLFEDGIAKVAQGVTTMDEVIRVVRE